VRNVAVRYGGIAFACGLLAAVGLAACSSLGSADSSAVQTDDAGSKSDARSPDGAAFPGTDAGGFIEANAIVLVHAAAFPAFRICFEGAASERPQPTDELMPESNVVGVDVGTAVRLPAHGGKLGRAFVFPESVLRSFYPGGVGPSCQTLLNAAGTKAFAVEVGEVTDDVSRGVHALVLGGCRPANVDAMASTDRCGASWTAASGNLELTTLSLMAYARLGATRLSVQLVQLSPSLQRRAEGRALGLAFGPIEAGAPDPFVEGAVTFGEPVPNPPADLDYAAADLASYATSGVFVTLGGALDDAGAPLDDGGTREVVVAQSLADIQKRSSPRSLPPDWFAAASSYVVLSVGDTDPRLGDGGPDDDPRRNLHLLAIPLATPDAGAPDAAQ
jgi:hypothetical protein